jgi:hypothetical protein
VDLVLCDNIWKHYRLGQEALSTCIPACITAYDSRLRRANYKCAIAVRRIGRVIVYVQYYYSALWRHWHSIPYWFRCICWVSWMRLEHAWVCRYRWIYTCVNVAIRICVTLAHLRYTCIGGYIHGSQDSHTVRGAGEGSERWNNAYVGWLNIL